MADKKAGAAANVGSTEALSLHIRSHRGFTFTLRIARSWQGLGVAAIGTLGVLGLGWLASHGGEIPLKRALERVKDGTADPEVKNIAKGSILVELHCHTVQSFLLFLDDFEKKKVKCRLEEEFRKTGFEGELEVTIVNAEEVFKTR